MSMKFRVWWPKELSTSEISKSSSSRSLLLFGWCISCSSSTCVDVVVAFAFPENFLSLHSSDSSIQEAIRHANEGMPVTLQEKSSLIVLGRCLLPLGNMDHKHKVDMVNQDYHLPFSKNAESLLVNGQHTLANPKNLTCGCLEFDGLLELYRHASLCSSTWIQFVHDACSISSADICWVPTLDHLHWNGKLSSQTELHVCYDL